MITSDVLLIEIALDEGKKAFPNLTTAQVAMVVAALVRIINAGTTRPLYTTITAIRYLFSVLCLDPSPVDYATMRRVVLQELEERPGGDDAAETRADEGADRRDP